jgi:hypothetical protein
VIFRIYEGFTPVSRRKRDDITYETAIFRKILRADAMKKSHRFIFVFLPIWACLMLAMTSVHAQTALQSGVPVSLTLSMGTYTNHYIEVPARASKLTVTLAADRGDLDLFLKYGAPLQGTNYGELYDGADFVSTAVDSHERIEVTPTSTPPLREGRWYITPVNVSQILFPIDFTVTATVEVSPAETKHKLDMPLSSAAAVPGNTFRWDFDVTPGTITGPSDLYVILLAPGLPPLFLAGYGVTDQIVPYQIGVNAAKEAGSIFPDIILPSSLPAGDYIFAGVMVGNFANLFDVNTWTSNAAVSVLSFDKLSPAQQAFVNRIGYPQQFIKTFREQGGVIRTDEAWIYIARGMREFFTNGVFMKEEQVVTTGLTPQPSRFRPENYSYDMTAQGILALHGQPLSTTSSPPGSGKFFDMFMTDKHFIYDGIVFGFSGDRLVFVIPSQ